MSTTASPGEVVVESSSLGKMIDKFKSRMNDDPKPEKPAPAPAAPPPPAPAPVEKPAEKTIVPKLEPLEKKPAPALAQAPAPEKPAEPPKGEPIPEKLSHKNFKEILAARDDFKSKWESEQKRAREIEAKLQEQSTRTPPELEEAKKQLAEKDHFINQFMLEQTEEFQNAFVRPIEQTILDAKEVVGGGEKGERLADILKAPDGKWKTDRLKEFVSELEDDYEKGAVRDAANTLRKLERSRKDELSKANLNVQALKQLHSKQAEERATQQLEARERLTAVALDVATRTLPEFQETEDPAHNISVSENKAMLKKFLGSTLPPDEMATMAVWAVHGIRARDVEKAANEKIAALEAEIQKLSAASPDFEGAGGNGDAAGKADTPEKMGARFLKATQSGIPGR